MIKELPSFFVAVWCCEEGGRGACIDFILTRELTPPDTRNAPPPRRFGEEVREEVRRYSCFDTTAFGPEVEWVASNTSLWGSNTHFESVDIL